MPGALGVSYLRGELAVWAASFSSGRPVSLMTNAFSGAMTTGEGSGGYVGSGGGNGGEPGSDGIVDELDSDGIVGE